MTSLVLPQMTLTMYLIVRAVKFASGMAPMGAFRLAMSTTRDLMLLPGNTASEEAREETLPQIRSRHSSPLSLASTKTALQTCKRHSVGETRKHSPRRNYGRQGR